MFAQLGETLMICFRPFGCHLPDKRTLFVRDISTPEIYAFDADFL
jgi:hypothetical protein